MDETNDYTSSSTATATPPSEPAAFCQDCGRPLTRETMRPVGNGVFCEPCLQVRLAGGIPGTAGAAGAATGAMPPIPGEPSPGLAGFLGLLPGVGAMYNGQFAKGIAHIAIFAVLVSLSDHVNGVFGLLVAGWVAYQVFDAIHTARARRDGLPLPNTFGLNDIGDRVMAGRNASGHWNGTHWTPPAAAAPAPAAAPPAAPWAHTAAPTQDATPAPDPTSAWTAVSPGPVAQAAVQQPYYNASHHANWAGYVPPTTFAGPGNPAAAPYAAYDPAVPVAAVVPPSNSFPGAAAILIGFGVLFLLANLIPNFHLNGEWITPLVLGSIAAWMMVRRVSFLQRMRAAGLDAQTPYLHSILYLRFPLLLALLAILFLLQALNIATIGQTWPLLLIMLGAFLFFHRSAGLAAVPAPDPHFPGAAPHWAPTEPAAAQSIIPRDPSPIVPSAEDKQ